MTAKAYQEEGACVVRKNSVVAALDVEDYGPWHELHEPAEQVLNTYRWKTEVL